MEAGSGAHHAREQLIPVAAIGGPVRAPVIGQWQACERPANLSGCPELFPLVGCLADNEDTSIHRPFGAERVGPSRALIRDGGDCSN